jgi:hypothetical protein
MFERFSDGVLGLFLFFSHWLSPGADDEIVRIVSMHQTPEASIVSCAISLSWNEQMKDLVDAGIPISFHFRTITQKDTGALDTQSCIRTLQCNVAEYTYSFCDSIRTLHTDTAFPSKQFSNLLIALEKFTQWETRLCPDASRCRIEAELQRTSATRLGRKIDMSQVCGYRFFATSFTLKHKHKERP